MRNVALFGGMAAGKSTLADALCEMYGFASYSLAWNLKGMVEEVYGTLDKTATVDGWRNANVEMSIREVLQGIGEAVKTVDQDFWIKWFLKDTDLFAANGIPVVCDDGRLWREADVLRSYGWTIVLVDTPADVRWERYARRYGRMPSESEQNHRTEQELGLIRYDLTVDGLLPIERQVELVMDKVEDFGHLS